VSSESEEALAEEVARLRAELSERRASLPAHSIRPRQLLALEHLEERIAELSRRLGAQK
jgi:hypothetical protein